MTLRKILWFILWILSVVGISHYGGAASYGLFFALTLLPLISLIYLLAGYFQCKPYQTLHSMDVVAGQPVPYSLILRNEGFLGISCVRLKLFSDFSLVEAVTEDTEYALLPGEEFGYETSLTCKYRGEYEVGIRQMIFVDFFKLFRFTYRPAGRLRVTVYPRLAELTGITQNPLLSTILQQESTSIHKEPDVVVRNYIRGDHLKYIHWKNTARMGQLLVRKNIDEAKQEVTLLFDTCRYFEDMTQYLPLESRILEVALSLGRYFAKQNTRLTFYYAENGLQKQTVENARSFETAYHQISKAAFHSSEHFSTLLENCLQNGLLLHTRLLIGVLHQPTPEILQMAEQICQNGTLVLFYIVTDEGIRKYTTQNTYGCNILALPIEAEWEGLL